MIILLVYISIFIIVFYLLLNILNFDSSSLRVERSSNSLKSAQKLQLQLLEIKKGQGDVSLEEYKFYTRLVKKLIKFRNLCGSEIQLPLQEIKVSLAKDIRENKKINDLFYGGIFQYLFIFVFSIVFYLIAINMIEIGRFSLVNILTASLWSCLGIMIYCFLFVKIKLKLFSHFGACLEAIYSFKILMNSSFPLNRVVVESGVTSLKYNKEILFLKNRIEVLIKTTKNQGVLSKSDLDLLFYEIWDAFEVLLIKLQKIVSVLKLFLLLLFVVPSYLFLVFSLIEATQVI